MLMFKFYSKLRLTPYHSELFVCCTSVIRRQYSYNSFSNNSMSPENHTPAKDNFLKNKFNDLVVWYEQVTGMDEVRFMQNKVLEEQDKFVAAQEKRREMAKELSRVEGKLKEIYSELESTSRGEERYLQLITQEHAILKDERKLHAEFALVEREERDSFTTLSSCVKESHEKERAQAERTKYWSIIGSIIGTVIGIAGSSINNEFKMRELKKLVYDLTTSDITKSDINEAVMLAQYNEHLASVVSEIKNTIHSYVNEKEKENVAGRLDKLLHTINDSHKPLPENDKAVQVLDRKIEELKGLFNSFQRYDGQLIAIPNDLEALIQKQSQDTKLLLIGVSIISLVTPLLVSFFQR